MNDFSGPGSALEFRFWIKTDRDRNIVSARGSFLDGPPSGYISPGGDEFRHPNGVGGSVFYSNDEGGVWSEPILISGAPNPVPVPLPAAWTLLGAAVAGAHALRRVGTLRRRFDTR